MKNICRVFGVGALLACRAAVALPGAPAVTAAQQRALEQLVSERYPAAVAKPVLALRSLSAGTSRIVAELDLPPQRGLRNLCRITSPTFAFDGQWRETGRAQRVWLNRASCAARGAQVRLDVPVPDSEVILALERHQPLLARARLIMAGNSQCAFERSSRFYLTSIGLGTTRSGNENMLALGFTSDRHVALSLLARRSGADFDAWEVACTRPSSSVPNQ